MMYEVTVRTRPERCPKCGGKRIAAILYGMPMPSPELTADLEAGRVVLGGCCVEAVDPSWRCLDCDVSFYRQEDVDRAERPSEES